MFVSRPIISRLMQQTVVGVVATDAEIKKLQKYGSIAQDHIFLPFGVETMGPWGSEARLFFKHLCKSLLDSTNDPRAGAYLGQRISLAIQRVRRYHAGDFKPPSMDELPVPNGSWQARYDAKQRTYNATLLLGIATITGTILVAKASGLVYFNFSPPRSID